MFHTWRERAKLVLKAKRVILFPYYFSFSKKFCKRHCRGKKYYYYLDGAYEIIFVRFSSDYHLNFTRGHSRPLEATRGHSKPFEASRSHSRPLEAIRGHSRPFYDCFRLRPLDAIYWPQMASNDHDLKLLQWSQMASLTWTNFRRKNSNIFDRKIIEELEILNF